MPKNKTEEPKLSKQFILDHLDEDEVDLSMCNLPRVPVKELVSGAGGWGGGGSEERGTLMGY